MKRIFALMLAVLMLLCACGGNPSEETTPDTTITEGTTGESTGTENTTPDATEPVLLYTHPLTGEPLATPFTGRATAVSINNIKKAMPQSGIASADIIYEIEAEGGVTRLLAIFTELEGIKAIGPVRSDRTYFNNISASYDIPVVHCGGSKAALAGKYDEDNKLSKWEHIDQMSNGSYFYRDKERRENGYAYEHTLFTTGDKLLAVLQKKGYNKVYENGNDYGLKFSTKIDLNGETANSVVVDFRGSKTTTLTYDESKGVYKASQYKTNHIDEVTGETLSYRNVLVLRAPQTFSKATSKTRTYYDLIGQGEGYFACNGKIVPIKWSRKTVEDQFSYTLADGTPLTLGVGKSYIAIIDTGSKAGVTYK